MKHRKSKRIYADYTLSGSMIQFYVLKYFFSSEKFIVKKSVVHLLFLSSLQFSRYQKVTHLVCPGTRIKTMWTVKGYTCKGVSHISESTLHFTIVSIPIFTYDLLYTYITHFDQTLEFGIPVYVQKGGFSHQYLRQLFRLDIRKNFFTIKLFRLWNGCLGTFWMPCPWKCSRADQMVL